MPTPASSYTIPEHPLCTVCAGELTFTPTPINGPTSGIWLHTVEPNDGHTPRLPWKINTFGDPIPLTPEVDDTATPDFTSTAADMT